MADQKKYAFINPDDLKVVPATKWVLKPLIPAAEILVGCGAPKHLKTLLLQGALFTVASHLPDFFGYEIRRRRKVLYAIGEGGDAFLGRTKAWQKMHNVPTFEGHLRILRQLPNLADKSPVPLDVFKRMVEAEKFEPDIITFDTLNRTMPGANEDTPSLSLVFDRLGQLQEWRPGLTIVLLHHTKKDELKFRGGQVIAGNADGLLYVERPDMSVMRATVTCDWFRNAANFTAFSFTCGLAPVLTDEGSQDFPAINWIGPADAKTEDQDDQGWKSKRSAGQSAEAEAYVLIQAKLRYAYNDWFRDTTAAIRLKYNRGLGNDTFSAAIKRLVGRGLVIDYGDHYQVVVRGADGRAEPAGAPSEDALLTPGSRPYRGAGVPGAGVVTPEEHSGSTGSGSRENCNDEKTVAPEGQPPVNPLAEYEAELSRNRTDKAAGAKSGNLAQEAMEQLRKRKV